MRWQPDATYYAQLEAGAIYLAEKAANPAERAEHLKMAALYRGRFAEAREPSAAASASLH
jgi:hypothetical protein